MPKETTASCIRIDYFEQGSSWGRTWSRGLVWVGLLVVPFASAKHRLREVQSHVRQIACGRRLSGLLSAWSLRERASILGLRLTWQVCHRRLVEAK